MTGLTGRCRFAIVFLVVLVTATIQALHAPAITPEKLCIKIKEPELPKLIETNNVLVKVDRQYRGDGSIVTSGSEDDQYKELCRRYKSTSDERRRSLIVGNIAVDTSSGDDTGRNKKFAETLGASDESTWPQYLIFKKGTSTNHVIKYSGSDKSADAIGNFVLEQTGARIGIFVYSIDGLDKMVARFVAVRNGDIAANLRRKSFAYMARLIAMIPHQSETKPIADLYVKAMFQTLHHGREYAASQTRRIEGLIEKGDISSRKKEELSQKLHVLSRFTDPVKLSDEEERNFYLSWAVQIGMWIIMLILLFFIGPGDEQEEDPEPSVTKSERKGHRKKGSKKHR
uniref:Endoplasmic reticulum resident protein 29 C-terminal domain-containing protein n=1 Tax=Ditylum brightwellii TaxID=49249 RepID=A0A7S1ZFI7_9STRA|mmetsp:Transcript_30527/g.45478  ORF Transcript_30527/g.45478 Transcript_30527/m.45478 type:complete len:342 (+) Transcript_30527:103-1128(+)